MSGRNSQIARILALLDIMDVATRGLSVGELHEKLKERGHDAGKRTVYRDLEALMGAGFSIYVESDEGRAEPKENEVNQRWKLERSTTVNKHFLLSSRELFALFLAKGALTPLRETPFYQDLEAIFSKLEDRLGNRQVEFLQTLEGELKFEPGPQWGLGLDNDILETVRSACAEGHQLECDYYSVNSKKQSTRKLGPHYLYYAKGGLYLVAEDLNDHRVKIFAFPRIKSALMLEEPYDGVVQTPEEIFSGALGIFTGDKTETVVIEFDELVSQYVKERRWHTSQTVVQLEGGRVRMSFEVCLSPELYSWILGFGVNAKVIEPEQVRQKLATLAAGVVSIYGKSS